MVPRDWRRRRAGHVLVTLLRAKQRTNFALCRGRGRRNKLTDLFQLLTDTGVPEFAS